MSAKIGQKGINIINDLFLIKLKIELLFCHIERSILRIP